MYRHCTTPSPPPPHAFLISFFTHVVIFHTEINESLEERKEKKSYSICTLITNKKTKKKHIHSIHDYTNGQYDSTEALHCGKTPNLVQIEAIQLYFDR